MATSDDGAATFPAFGGLRRGRSARRLAAWGVALGLAPALVVASTSTAAGVACAAALAAGVAALARGPEASHGRLTVEGATLRWVDARGAAWERPRSALASGWRDGARVVLTFAGGDALVLDLGDAEAARRCLDAAGVGAGQRAIVFETRSTWLRMAWFFGAFAMGFVALTLALATLFAFMVFPWAGVVMLPLLGLTALATVVMLRPADSLEVLVGADGVAVRGEVDDRFVRYADLARVEETPRAIVLRLREGAPVTVDGPALGAWQRRALAARVRDALAAHRLSAAAERTRSLLARSDAPFEAWRDALRGRSAAVYRHHALTRDDLAAVVADAAAPPEQRVAAALALTGSDDAGDGRTRVRVAADATASDALRRAFERVLDDALDERAWRRLERAARR